jgi:hypothetical protein
MFIQKLTWRPMVPFAALTSRTLHPPRLTRARNAFSRPVDDIPLAIFVNSDIMQPTLMMMLGITVRSMPLRGWLLAERNQLLCTLPPVSDVSVIFGGEIVSVSHGIKEKFALRRVPDSAGRTTSRKRVAY